MRSVYFLLILFVLLAVGLSLISCSNLNFVCNDIFDSTLTLSEKADIIKQCSEEQIMWKKEF